MKKLLALPFLGLVNADNAPSRSEFSFLFLKLISKGQKHNFLNIQIESLQKFIENFLRDIRQTNRLKFSGRADNYTIESTTPEPTLSELISEVHSRIRNAFQTKCKVRNFSILHNLQRNQN